MIVLVPYVDDVNICLTAADDSDIHILTLSILQRNRPSNQTESAKGEGHDPRAATIRLPGHPVSRLRSRDSVWIGGSSARCPQGNAAAPDNRLDLGRPHGRGERERVFHPPNQAVGAVEPDPPAGHLYADLAPARGLACSPSQGPQASQHNGVPFRRRSGDRRRVHPAARAHHACRGAESIVGWQRALLSFATAALPIGAWPPRPNLAARRRVHNWGSGARKLQTPRQAILPTYACAEVNRPGPAAAPRYCDRCRRVG